MKNIKLVFLSVIVSIVFHIAVFLFFSLIFHIPHKPAKRNKPYFVDVVELPKIKEDKKIKEKHKLAANISKKGTAEKKSKKEKLPMIVKTKPLKQFTYNQKQGLKKGEIVKKSKQKSSKIVKIKGGLFDKNFNQKTINNTVLGAKEYEYENEKKEATVSIGTQSLKYASYMKHIKDKVQNTWIYPEDAREKGEQGELLILFSINKDGSLSRVSVVRSSGYESLDNAAVNAIKDAAPFPQLPKRLGINRLNIYATFLYKLSFYYVE